MRIVFVLVALIVKIQAEKLTKAENDNRLATCGSFSATKVLAGKKVAQTESPWSVFIKNRKGGAVCTGTIVSSRHILTATHCFANYVGNKWGTIHGGTYDANSCKNGHYELTDSAILSGISFESNKISISKNPKKVTLINGCETVNPTPSASVQNLLKDYTIVELSEDLIFSPSLHAACVSENKEDNKENVEMKFDGFGLDPPEDITQTAPDNVGILRHHTIKCVRVPPTRPYQFYAQSLAKKTIACSGDSGGGAIAQVNGKNTIVGVLSQTSCSQNRLKDPHYEMYDSVGFFRDINCQIAGICGNGSPSQNLAGNQNPGSAPTNDQNSETTTEKDEKSNKNPDESENDLEPEPKTAYRNEKLSIILMVCILMVFVWE